VATRDGILPILYGVPCGEQPVVRDGCGGRAVLASLLKCVPEQCLATRGARETAGAARFTSVVTGGVAGMARFFCSAW